MPKKATAAKKSQPQRQRFIEIARELEADETGEAFEKAFGKIVPPSVRKTISDQKKSAK